MKALTYIEHGKFALQEKAKPQLVSRAMLLCA